MLRGLLVVAPLLLMPAVAAAADPYKVKLVPFKLEAKLEGTFEPPTLTEVRLDPKRWSQFVVETAVPHGTRVGKGDVLVTVETDKIDEQIRDLEMGGRLADLAHGLLEREVKLLEKSTPLQLEQARRIQRIAAEDLKRYEEKEAALAAAMNDMSLKFGEFKRESAVEELDQLEKMYEQDDLTEESEEIVLKRARFEAEAARFFEKLGRYDHERTAALELPRRLESVRRASQAATLDLERAEAALPVAFARAKLELEKSINDRRKAAENLAELKADRKRMPITAPADGIVYYGRWRNGKWTDAENAAGRLRAGGQLDPRETVITIVSPGKLAVRSGVPEKDLARVPVDAPARVVPKAFPDTRLKAKVRNVSAVPVGNGRFEAVLDLIAEDPRLVAGMEAEIRVTAEQRAEALAIPKKAVFAEDLDDDQRFIYVVAAGKEPVKRTVAVGRSNDELVEITAGLTVGEEILLEKPSAPKPAESAKASEPAKPAETPKPADAAKPAEPAKAEAAAAPKPEPAKEAAPAVLVPAATGTPK
ncbi:MAG: HlyD family efflux transporter periplasmic adaptor subunit [Pirellulales bacterium]